MIKPSKEIDIVLGPKESRYSLVVAIAKRAREIAARAEEEGDILIEKPVDLAVEDFVERKFHIVPPVIEDDDE